MPAPSGATPRLGLPYPTPDDNVDVPRDIKALADKIDAGAMFIIGEIRWLPGLVPAGFIAADGVPKSRSAYAALFDEYGVDWGPGDGSTTFGIPDLRGRVPVGTGQGPGLTMRAVATKWGVEAVVLTDLQSGVNRYGATSGMNRSDPHFHYIPAYPDASGGILAVTNLANASSLNAAATQSTSVAHEHALVARNADAAHDNTQPSLAIPAFIYAGA